MDAAVPDAGKSRPAVAGRVEGAVRGDPGPDEARGPARRRDLVRDKRLPRPQEPEPKTRGAVLGGGELMRRDHAKHGRAAPKGTIADLLGACGLSRTRCARSAVTISGRRR